MANRQLDEEAIFHVARDIPNLDSRSKYLDQVCAGDLGLRERVEALLEVHEQEQSFLKSENVPASTAESTPVSEGPGQQIGRYKLLQKIGEGGFGVVFMAEQVRPVRRKVALKIIKPGMDTHTVVARFEAERQALALMEHPNIARVLDGGATESGRPYFVMELVKGVTLTEYCDANKVSTQDRLKLFMTVCQAVQHAHQKGIIHRDLKPSNVLVTLHDGQPVVKVIDFGVAKATNQQLTEKTVFTAYGQMVGTPQYMSPEQAEMSGLDVDTRSDVYSLGVLLYELLVGTTPLEGERLRTAGYAEMQRIIREEEPPKPSTRLSTGGDTLTIIAKHRGESPERLHRMIRGDLDWIVMKSLEKDRTRRYQTASDFAADVQRSLSDQPVVARPPSTWYQIRKYTRRHRALVATAVAILLTTIAGVLAISNGYLVASRAVEKEKRAVEKEKATSHALADKVDELGQTKDELSRFLQELREEAFRNALTAAMAASEDTERLIERAEKVGVSTERIAMLRGQYLLYQGKPGDAIPHLESAADLEQQNALHNSVMARGMLTVAYHFSGDIGRWLDYATTMENVSDKTLANSSAEDLLFWSQATCVLVDPNRVLTHVDSSLNKGRYPLSLAVRAEALTWRAIHKENATDVKHALASIAAAELMMPNNPYVIHTKILAYFVAGILGVDSRSDDERVRMAKEMAQQIMDHFPDYPHARSFAAGYLEYLGETKEALEQYRLIESDNPLYAAMPVLTLYRLGRWPEAEEEMADFSMLASRLYAFPALLETENGRQQCQRLYEECVANSKDDRTEYQHAMALAIQLLLGKREIATHQAQQWLESDNAFFNRSRSVGNWGDFERSKLQYIAGQFGEAELLEHASWSKLTEIDAHWLIGCNLLSQGKRGEAKEHFAVAAAYDARWFVAHSLAAGMLKHIKGDSSWPQWLPAGS